VKQASEQVHREDVQICKQGSGTCAGLSTAVIMLHFAWQALYTCWCWVVAPPSNSTYRLHVWTNLGAITIRQQASSSSPFPRVTS